MRTYKRIISLSKNDRGIWDLDTIKGCSSGMALDSAGCYGDCYAFKIARSYGIDFSKSVKRFFKDELHRRSIVRQIERVDMPFIRIGGSVIVTGKRLFHNFWQF